MNAFTTKEYTAFYVRMLGDDLDLGLDILSDIVWSPALRAEEVDSERQVILEEVLMHLDEPADFAQERFADALFPAHPLGREVLGDPEVIKSVTVDEIRQFLAVHYRPANIVVAAAGQVDHGARRRRTRTARSPASPGAPAHGASALRRGPRRST